MLKKGLKIPCLVTGVLVRVQFRALKNSHRKVAFLFPESEPKVWLVTGREVKRGETNEPAGLFCGSPMLIECEKEKSEDDNDETDNFLSGNFFFQENDTDKSANDGHQVV